MESKITIIGAGNVGASTAQRILDKKLGDVILLDIKKEIAQGKALDLFHASGVIGYENKIIGTNSYEETKNSDLIIVTSGSPRKKGMTREDLLKINAQIVSEVVKKAKEKSPQALLIVVTNPLDVMAWVAYQVSKFPKNKVMGMSSGLDTTRFKTLIAQELNVSVNSVEALVIGQHSDSMIPLPQYSKVKGKPLPEIISSKRIKKIIKRTINSGAEVIKLMQTSAYYAPSATITDLVESILKDKKKIIPCSVYCQGEYNLKDVFIGLPAKIGKKGVEEIIELELEEEQEKQLKESAKKLKELYQKAKQFI